MIHRCDIMIHGKCSHFYCGKCVKHNTSVDVLEDACEIFNVFNQYEYKSNKSDNNVK